MDEPEDNGEAWKAWLGRISASRSRRDDHLGEWQNNVTARKGGVRRSGDTISTLRTTGPGVTVNQDWPLTKAKIAQLYSQTPEIRLTPRYPEFGAAVQPFGRELNAVIETANVGSTIEEVLADVVNAAGIGGVLVSCETRTQAKAVPAQDPALLPPDAQLALASGQMELDTVTVDETVDLRYLVQRISPADLLIPDDFTGSNYNQARWLGEEGRLTWAQALNAFAPSETNRGLTEADKDQVLGKDKRSGTAAKSLNADTSSKFRDTDVVNYQQIFYWRHYYHADETSFSALQRVVFVDGLEEPVVNEPYKAQERLEDGRLVGVTRNPIQILTLTYVSDESLPPSDSSIGRCDVDELNEIRESEQAQRKHSIPIRWGDTNRISANSRARLDAGDYQGFIWTNGPGDRAVGEVARASYAPERYRIEDSVKNDLTEKWQVGTNQTGAFASGERSASEARIIQQNFNTRVGQERDKVTKFFVGIAEVLAGHIALYGTFDLPDEIGFERTALATGFTYTVRSDSTVRLDAQQRIEQLKEFFNLTFQTGYINPKPIVEEWAELSGLDPAKVVVDPTPKPPEPVKVSVSKAEDIMNPLFLALLMRTQQGPSPEDLSAAIKLQQAALMGAPTVTMASAAPEGMGEVKTPDVYNADIGTAPRMERRAEDGGA